MSAEKISGWDTLSPGQKQLLKHVFELHGFHEPSDIKDTFRGSITPANQVSAATAEWSYTTADPVGNDIEIEFNYTFDGSKELKMTIWAFPADQDDADDKPITISFKLS